MYHIVTPFYRSENESFLLENTEGFIWHKVEGSVPDFKDPAYGKINYFIEKYPIIDEDYYQILMDDDALPPGFLETNKEIEGDVVVFSMKRGHHIPDPTAGISAHPTTDLIAREGNMYVGCVGLQQIRFKGKVFKHLYCKDHPWADGMIAQDLVKSGIPIKYVEDVFILFNYLEPGRWDKPHEQDHQI